MKKLVFLCFLLHFYAINAQTITEDKTTLSNLITELDHVSKTKNYYKISELQTSIGKLLRTDKEFELSNTYFLNAIKNYEKIKAFDAIANTHLLISDNYFDLNIYEKKIDHIYKAYYLLDSTKNTTTQFNILNYYSQVLQEFNELEKSKNILQKAFNLLPKEEIPFKYYQNLAWLNVLTKDYITAKINIENAIKIQDSLLVDNTYSYNTLAIIFAETGNINEAIKVCLQNIKLFKQQNKVEKEIVTRLNLVEYYKRSKLKDLELNELTLIVNLSESHGSFYYASIANELLANYYENQQQYHKALKTFKAFKKNNDSILKGKSLEKVNALNIKLETFQKENRLKLLTKKNLYQKKLMNKTIIISVLILLLLVFLIAIMRLRLSRNKILREKDLKIYHKKITIANTKLTTHSLNIIQKNKMLNELRKDLISLYEKTPSSKLRQINTSLRNTARLENEWENFKLFFEEVNPNFYKNLLKHFPDLSKNDLKLAALIKLDFSIKQSADILNLTPDSVKTARYRLRKKLQLTSHDEKNLHKYINAL